MKTERNSQVKVSEQDHQTWHGFLDKLNDLVVETLGEEASVIIAAQFGELGQDEYDECLVSSNLSPNALLPALRGVHTAATQLVAEINGVPLTKRADAEIRPGHEYIGDLDVPEGIDPESVRAHLAEVFGVPVETIEMQYIGPVDESGALVDDEPHTGTEG